MSLTLIPTFVRSEGSVDAPGRCEVTTRTKLSYCKSEGKFIYFTKQNRCFFEVFCFGSRNTSNTV